MAYDEVLGERVREYIATRAEPVELKMFGGLAFMVNTHMACGIIGEELMVRVGAEGQDAALARGARPMDFTGKPMRGFVIAQSSLLTTDTALERWVEDGVAYAQSLPPKPPKAKKPRRRRTDV